MKIKNNNTYNIMFDTEFIKAGEVKEIEEKNIIKLLLKQPNVEEYIDIKDAKQLEAENKELKAKLEETELEKAKEKATELGIKFAKNIGLKSLLEKIKKAEDNKE